MTLTLRRMSQKYNVFTTKAGFKPDQARDESGKWTDRPGTFLGYHSSKYEIDELSKGDILDSDTYSDLIRSAWYNYGPNSIQTDDVNEMAEWFESEGYGFTFVSDEPIMGTAFQSSKYKYGDSLYRVYGYGDEYLLDDHNELGATIIISKKPLYFEIQKDDPKTHTFVNGIKAGFKPDQARDESGKWSKHPFPNSKVKDIVYHGTGADFEKYRIGGKSDVNGIYFTDDLNYAQSFALAKGGNKGIIKEAFINITNPATHEQFRKYVDEMYDKLPWDAEVPEIMTAATKKLIDLGYDGVIRKDGQANEYIVFDSKQVIDKEAKSNTFINGIKAGFNPDQTRDETGKWSKKPGKLQDRPCFKKWFKDSKAVDADGEPKLFFHGTTHDFNEFSKERGNPENDWGVGFYFSTSLDDVDQNYDEIGPDLENRIQQRIEQLENDDFGIEDPRAQAEEELVGGKNRIIFSYLSLQNPLIVGAPAYGGEAKETVFTLDWDEENQTESGTLVDFVENIKPIVDSYGDWSSMDYNRIISDIYDHVSGQGQLYASELTSILRASEGLMYATGDEGNLISREVMREMFEAAGFDGVIDNLVPQKFGNLREFGRPMTGIYDDTQHAIAFEPGQIKRADAKSFCHETDIRKSNVFVNGKQKAGFKPDQARDRSGKWTSGTDSEEQRAKEEKSKNWAKMSPRERRLFAITLTQKELEDLIANQPFESGAVMDENGIVELFRDGQEKSLAFTVWETENMFRDRDFTHSHPGEFWLSPQDILNHIEFGSKSTSAITGDMFSKVTTNSERLDRLFPDLIGLRDHFSRSVNRAIGLAKDERSIEHGGDYRYWTRHENNMFMGERVIRYLAEEDRTFSQILNLEYGKR